MSKRALVVDAAGRVRGFWIASNSYEGPSIPLYQSFQVLDESGALKWKWEEGALVEISPAERALEKASKERAKQDLLTKREALNKLPAIVEDLLKRVEALEKKGK
jgi:hypothetical protein